MNNTFKYIAALVALLSGFALNAQNFDAGTYGESKGIGYVKSATVNDDGTYTIDLETFVTGEVTQTNESIPADVVLVLDVSGSMSDDINTYTYSAARHTAIYGVRADVTDTDYFYKYTDDSYYPVFIGRGGTQGNRRYYLFFTVNGVRYYINTSGQVVTDEPSNVSDRNTDLWNSNVILYTRTSSSSGMTKIEALQAAVLAFISQINTNDRIDPETEEERDERLGNRIAIVAFSGANYAGQSNHDNSIKLNTGWVELGEDKDIDDNTGYNSLIQNVNSLSTGGGTHVEYGMQDALALINNSTADIRTVVLFTDGIPGTGTWGVTETTNSANGAIDYSRQINAITIGSGNNATTPKIYSVGLFEDKPQSGDNTFNYMNYVSSNYPGARSMTNAGTKDSNNYYMDASGGSADDLKEIFISIAHSAGGSGNTDVAGTSTLTVDVVSSSFSVPSEFNTASDVVEVLVAPCTGKTIINNKEYLTFGVAKAPDEYGLGTITPSIDVDNNKVSTTGFDYSANWCGPDPTNTNPQSIQPYYHGFKQIIRFVITVNEDAVGGPAVETNDSDSGIYLPGETKPLITFNRPTVKLPVQIWIQKNGLQGDDSAVFTLARAPFTENFDPEKAKWESITKIVVGPEDLTADGLYIKKQVGLDPDYYYRIKEDAWAFGYQYQYGGVLYTVGDEVVNPFVFTNTPKNKKFDEATARNIFTEKVATTPTEPETPDTPSEKAKK